MPSIIRLIVTIFLLSILPSQVHALTPAQVFDKVKDAVVIVKTLDAQGKLIKQGSGVLIPSGKIATNCHVVEGGAFYQVGQGEHLFPATLFAEDGDKDICLLDAKGFTGNPAQLGKAASLKVGDPVYAVGAPRGLELSLSDGIVAQLRGEPPPLIQTTVAISHGSSGGGLFDREGRLVGLTTLYIEGGQNLNFAMPVEWIGEVKPGRKPASGGFGQIDWLKRAMALDNMKDWPGLLNWSRKWIKSEPKNADAWGFLGVACVGLKRYDDAIEAYRQALHINPEYARAWNDLGAVYEDLTRYDDAIEAYRQALRINPKYVRAWAGLALAYVLSGNRSAALDAVRELRRLDPEQADSINCFIAQQTDQKEHGIKASSPPEAYNKMDADTKSLLFNVIGGIIVSVLTAIYVGTRHRFRSYNLQRLSGFQFKTGTEIRMTYGQLLLDSFTDQFGRPITHPYRKTSRRGGAPLAGSFSIEHPISECEVRASTYIATLLGLPGKLRPLLVSDTDASSLLDSNFISFGGPFSNYKTADALASEANIFIRMSPNGFLFPNGENLPFTSSNEDDYGIILRITPPEFPTRSWIVCAGLGEWGTSGSSWFLANNWQELIKRIYPMAYWSGVMDIPDFMAMIRVRPGQDQSARMIALYRNDKGQIDTVIQA